MENSIHGITSTEKGKISSHAKNSSTGFTTPPPDGKKKSRRNGIIWHWCTKCKRNGPHETQDCKSKIRVAKAKAQSYAAALAAEEFSAVEESDWGSDIDEPPTRSTKRVKAKTTQKRKKRRVTSPPVSEDDSDDIDSIGSLCQFSDEDME